MDYEIIKDIIEKAQDNASHTFLLVDNSRNINEDTHILFDEFAAQFPGPKDDYPGLAFDIYRAAFWVEYAHLLDLRG